MLSREECHCDCHRVAGIRHFIACCDGEPIDFNCDEVEDEDDGADQFKTPFGIK